MAGFNYGRERKKMEKEWKKTAKICKEAGMSDQQISEIYRMWLDELNGDRRFSKHTFSYNEEEEEEGEKILTALSYAMYQSGMTQDKFSGCGRYSWIDDIATPEIVMWLKSLNEIDIELLTLLVVDGMSQSEAAEKLGKHRPDICRRIKRLRKSLEKVLPEYIKREYIK